VTQVYLLICLSTVDTIDSPVCFRQ